jgi:hypothetical protein
MAMKWTPRRLRRVLNAYPPYLGAGVRVTRIDPDWSEIHVSMRLRWWNRNAVGTHFGGSLYSMVDPHLMLLFIKRLGSEYVVWDRSATIDFRKPGRGTLTSVLRVPDSELDQARLATSGGAAYRPTFDVEILDEAGDVVALVTKTLHIREKQ